MEIENFLPLPRHDIDTQIERARVEELEWALVNDGKKVDNEVRAAIYLASIIN
jgi:hypothetical protein